MVAEPEDGALVGRPGRPRAFCLVGAAEKVAARLRKTFKAGASGAFLQHVGSYDPPHDLIEAVGSDALPWL